jgi:preprotein translocase subunit SecA
MRAIERFVLLQFIDSRWREHLYDMDYLREGIHLRGFAQIEPIVAYKNEAFALFTDLMASIWSDFTRMIYNLEVEAVADEEEPAQRYEPGASSSSTRPGRVSYSGGSQAAPSALATAAAGNGELDGAPEEYDMPAPVQQRVLDSEQQIGRNDPCWCGSGKKFKRCHGA